MRLSGFCRNFLKIFIPFPDFSLVSEPGEPESSGHVTIIHRMLAWTLWVYILRLKSISIWRKCWENFCKTFFAYSQNSWYFISYLFSQQLKRLMFRRLTVWWGRNESDWLIFSGWLTRKNLQNWVNPKPTELSKLYFAKIGARQLYTRRARIYACCPSCFRDMSHCVKR